MFLTHTSHLKGFRLLVKFSDSPSRAIMAAFPEYGLLPWKFAKSQSNYWQDKENRLQFFEWLKKELKLPGMEGWYSVTYDDVTKHGGTIFIENSFCMLDCLLMRLCNTCNRWCVVNSALQKKSGKGLGGLVPESQVGSLEVPS
jgi:hypothetical protein